jgi:phage replication O-like protein O
VANPQTENGFIRIASEIAEALCRVNLCQHETRVLWCLFRLTYGWNKTWDWISLSMFSRMTGLDRRTVHRSLKKLELRNFIVISRDDKRRPKYRFQKNFEKWKMSSPKMTTRKKSQKQDFVISTADSLSSPQMTTLSSPEPPTIDIQPKKEITIDKGLTPLSLLRGKEQESSSTSENPVIQVVTSLSKKRPGGNGTYLPDAALTPEERQERYTRREAAKRKAELDKQILKQRGEF